MTVNTFSDKAQFDFFGRNSRREHNICPHCRKRGNLVDEGDLLWNDRPKAKEYDYVCSVCHREWVIRIYRYTGFEKHPGPYGAVIYIPGSDPVPPNNEVQS